MKSIHNRVQSSNHYLFLLLSFVILGTSSQDPCNWRKSGLNHHVKSREIENVKLSCESGQLEWKYPTTALQIDMTLPYSSADFIACLLPSLDFSGASLYLIENQELKLIFADPEVAKESQGKLSETSCVNSTNGQLKLLLMGTVPRVDISRKIAGFRYEMLSNGQSQHRTEHNGHKKRLGIEKRNMFTGEMEVCRPCTTEELLDLYCTADFVVRGQVKSARDDVNYKWTNIEFLANHIIAQEPSDWTLFKSPLPADRSQSNYGVLRLPAQCGFQMPKKSQGIKSKILHDANDFVAMGNYYFEGGWLECFPRYKDLAQLLENYMENEGNSRRRKRPNGCDYGKLLKTANGDEL